MNNQENFYEVLGVSEDATLDKIKEAWRRLVKHYHPDRNRSQNASQKTQEINEAWGTLKDAVKRRDYDTRLRQEREARAQEARAREARAQEARAREARAREARAREARAREARAQEARAREARAREARAQEARAQEARAREARAREARAQEARAAFDRWPWRTLFYVGVISSGLVVVAVLGSVVRKEASHPPTNDTPFVYRGPRQSYRVQSDGRVYLRDRDALFSLSEEEAIEYFRSTPGVNFASNQEIRAHLCKKRKREYAERRSTQVQHMMNSLFDTVTVGLFSHLQDDHQRRIQELNSTATFVGRILGLLVWAIFFGYSCRRME